MSFLYCVCRGGARIAMCRSCAVYCMHDESNVAWARACKFACKTMAEYNALAWVKRQNVARGAAPSAFQVYQLLFYAEAGLCSSR